MTSRFPVLIEAATLEAHLDDDAVRIVDVSQPQSYLQGHIPGAVHLDYSKLVLGQPPAPGLVAPPQQISAALSTLGITPDTHVVAYDNEGSGRACRLLWTLDIGGHRHFSLLNGGTHAWAGEGHRLSTQAVQPAPIPYDFTCQRRGIITREEIVRRLGEPGFTLVDARTPEEYHGLKRTALHAGHIPGARNLNWLDTMDRERNLRFRPEAELRALLSANSIVESDEIVVYCQTHHRSAHSYIMLRHLGFPNLSGYPGSWSEWGNHPDSPVEV